MGISQRKAAAALGISQALLSHYENGIREPGLAFVARACDFYHVSADFLLGRTSSRDGSIIEAAELYDASDALLTALPDCGVGLVIDPGCDLTSSRRAVELAAAYPHVYAAVGIHPENCGGCTDDDLAALRPLAQQPKVVAIGEIGLDYYWEENPPREFQQQVFRRQLALARELQLPVIVHDREAHADTLSIVREFPDVTGVFHCFSGSPEMAQELLKLGWYLGFDGPVTYKNARRAPEVAAVTPLDRMLIETDSPYMTPVPYRGKRNDSVYVHLVAEKLAEWKGIAPEEMARLTTENGKRLFRIS